MFYKSALFIILCFVVGCTSNQSTEDSTTSSAQTDNNTLIKVACGSPRMVQDIWKLEPMLTEKGLIKADMTSDQKEKIIRGYIAQKNEQYQKCNQ